MKAMVAVVSDSAFKLGTAQREGLACWLWACGGCSHGRPNVVSDPIRPLASSQNLLRTSVMRSVLYVFALSPF